MPFYILEGLVIGFSIAAPVGPIGLLQAGGLLSAYLSSLFLTLTNPMTILSFVAVFAGLGLGASANYLGAASLVAGVFIGSALWWLLLSCGAARFHSRLGHGWMRFINRSSGSVIFAFGIYSLSTFWFR